MKPPKLIIFDWDGTLVDSISRILNCFYDTYKYFDLPSPEEIAIRRTIGLPLQKGFEQLVVGVEHPGLDALGQKYRDFWLAPKQKTSPAFSFSRPLIQRLHQQGHLLAVATGKSRAGLDREIHDHGIAEHFQATVCGDESMPKPHPQMLQSILTEISIAPQDALMLGDSPLDLAMANRAGIPAVGVLTGSGLTEDLAEHNPVAILEHAGDLERLWSKAHI